MGLSDFQKTGVFCQALNSHRRSGKGGEFETGSRCWYEPTGTYAPALKI